jgi:hypothetical protein
MRGADGLRSSDCGDHGGNDMADDEIVMTDAAAADRRNA